MTIGNFFLNEALLDYGNNLLNLSAEFGCSNYIQKRNLGYLCPIHG